MKALMALAAFAVVPITSGAEALLDGHRVYYESHGQGARAVVFIHGWTCDSTFWRLQTPEVAKKWRVLALDLPGHGRSEKPEIVYSMELFGRAVEAVMRDAGVQSAVLVGHSMGGPVVRQFLKMHPSKVLAFVAVDSRFPKPPPPEEVEKRLARLSQFVASLEGPQYRETATKMIEGMFVPSTGAEIRTEILTKMLATPPHVAASAMKGMGELNYWKTERIEVPVLAISAANPTLTADAEQFARSFIPKLDYRVWEGVGHFLMMEKPAEFNRALIEFLDRLR